MSSDKRKACREPIEIMADILHACIERRRKTALMLKARLNYEQVSYYIRLLSDKGLLKQCTQNETVFYGATEKGRQLLYRQMQITQLICEPLE